MPKRKKKEKKFKKKKRKEQKKTKKRAWSSFLPVGGPGHVFLPYVILDECGTKKTEQLQQKWSPFLVQWVLIDSR